MNKLLYISFMPHQPRLLLQDIALLFEMDNFAYYYAEQAINRLETPDICLWDKKLNELKGQLTQRNAVKILPPAPLFISPAEQQQKNALELAQNLANNVEDIDQIDEIIKSHSDLNISILPDDFRFFYKNKKEADFCDLLIILPFPIKKLQNNIEQMLEEAGLNEYNIYHCFMAPVKSEFHDLNNKQFDIYLFFVKKFIDILHPKVILVLGSHNFYLLTQHSLPWQQKCYDYKGDIKIIPSYLANVPTELAHLWNNFLYIKYDILQNSFSD